MRTTVDFHIASVAILTLVLLYAAFSRGMRHDRKYGTFLSFCVSVVLSVLSGAACSLSCCFGCPDSIVAPVATIAIIFQGISAALLLAYTVVLCRNGSSIRKERAFAAVIPLVFAIVATASSRITGSVFYFDESGKVMLGSLYVAVYLCMAFYPVMCMAYALIYRRMLRTLDLVAVWLAAAFVLLCVFFEVISKEVHPVTFGLTMAVLSVFVTAGSPFEFVDSLTHSYDVAAFRVRVADLLRARRRFSVVIVVLRHVDMLNALLGSSVADEAIQHCARATMLAGRTRQVYRVRGSAFALVAFSRRECRRVTEGLLERFSSPQSLGSSSVDLDVVTAYAASLDAFDSAEDVAQYVDFLIDRLKEGGDVPEDQRDLTEAFMRRREVRRYLVQALKRKEIATYVQPLYSFKEERFVSVEALSRLYHPTLGAIPPDEFIEAAESEGLIAEMGIAQFETLCRFVAQHAAKLEKAGIRSIKVNLSPLELVEAGFGSQMVSLMDSWHIDPALFQFEVTETAATRYGNEVENTVGALCEAGSKLCMDDFGSGFANFDAVLNLPFSVVKIDRALLVAASRDESAAELYRSIIYMMNRQGFSTVAEGVETAEQDAFVRSLPVDEGQGYFYAKPVPLDDIFDTICEINS